MTKGNLSSHLSRLEEAGLVRIEKQFVGKKPHTQVALTDKAYRAIEQHWQFLESLHRLGMGLLILTTIIVALISALPVVLLFFITAMPPLVAAVLLLLDVDIVAALLRLGCTPLNLAGAALGQRGRAQGLDEQFARRHAVEFMHNKQQGELYYRGTNSP